jgi:putative endonuclease
MAWVYVLRSLKDKRLYIGSTRKNINQRITRHNSGKVKSTFNRRPLVLVYNECCRDYSIARKRELYLKSGSGREHLNRILMKRAGTQVAKGDRL